LDFGVHPDTVLTLINRLKSASEGLTQ